MAEIPDAPSEIVDDFTRDYELAFHKGTEAELAAAKLRLVWALAHSQQSKHNARAVDMADEMLAQSQAPDDVTTREVEYIKAVALYRLKRYVKCRQQCAAILQIQPESRQVVTLKEAAEEALIREGMIGVGILGGVVGVVGVVAGLALASRR